MELRGVSSRPKGHVALEKRTGKNYLHEGPTGCLATNTGVEVNTS
jgi:hypothetical protein